MHILFKRIAHKNEKILRRELAFAHTSIALLALAMIAVLWVGGVADNVFDPILVAIVSTLLAVVSIISISIVTYIAKYTKR